MPVVEEVCTITAKGQTTVPKAIRQALGVGYGGKIAFRVEDGQVTVHAQPDADEDPALAPFLAVLAADMAVRPDAVRPIPESLLDQLDSIAAEMGAMGEVDLDAPIEGDSGL